jgi:uncharacterized membrane-anchored protein YitT (DUF2179 family)
MNQMKKISYVLLGLVLTSLGIKLLSIGSLTFGGTAGIASILTFLTNSSWGMLFFIVNLPFFFISIQQLGKWFTISSLFSITGISLFRDWLDLIVPVFTVNIFLAAILSGFLIGVGVTLVLNNGSSLGGIHILGLYMDKRFGLNRGLIIFSCDALIVIFALAMVGWQKALLSILCIFIASTIIGRYKQSPIKESQNEIESSLETESARS